MSAITIVHATEPSSEESLPIQPRPSGRVRRSRAAGEHSFGGACGVARLTTFSAKGPKAFEFISSDGTGKATGDTRQFIRSHVMRGKNTNKRLERFPQANNDHQEEIAPPESSPDNAIWTDTRRKPRVHNNHFVLLENNGGPTRVAFPWTFPSPVCMPSDLRLMEFPEVMDDKMRGLMFRCKFPCSRNYPADNVASLHGHQGDNVPC